jgi:putative CocE/NonD family hydrolase
MRRHLPTALTSCVACFACSAGLPRAGAAAARGAPPAEPPLIAAELDKDGDVGRAIREHYTKHEHRIPMRDGARLFTAVYVPKDTSRRWPILMRRTPYGVGPYGADNYPDAKSLYVLRGFAPSVRLLRDGYVFVHQDVRGRMMSEGTFVDVRPRQRGGVDETTDAWDTIEWLVRNVPGHNGRVGVWGISYAGFYAAQAAVDAHPALKAVSPQAPVTDWFMGDDFHHNGAFFLADAFAFYASFGKPRPKPTKKLVWEYDYEAGDGYQFFLDMGPLANANARFLKGEIAFWNELMEHGTLDDYWRARDPRPHYRDVKPAVMTVGGWFDAEDLFGALETYRAFERASPRADNVLVMGPWKHGGWARTDGDAHGDITFGQKTSPFYREHIERAFFERHLKRGAAERLPEAWVFETGTNQWQRHDRWPPSGAKPLTLYLRAGGKLAASPPGATEGGADAYPSDPHKPVPYRAAPTMETDASYMSDDQRFAARRPDVLVYATAELDADVALAGPLEASLWVTTTGTDADFIVKLVDVYPHDYRDPEPNPRGVRMGGYQQLVRAEVMRGKFRTSFERPEPFKPGEPALVRFTLPDVCHSFRSGHRIMVQVQSTWFPLVDRNPQTFVDIYRATEKDFRAATHQVLRTAEMPSGLRVLVTRAGPRGIEGEPPARATP